MLSVWTEWLTWVTDALGAWFAPGWCTKRTPAKTVIIETIIIIITLRAVISFVCSLCQSRKLKSWTFRHSYYFAVVHWGLTSLFKWSLWKTALSSLFISRVFIFTFQFICYFMQIPLKSWTAVTVRVNVWKLLTSRHQTTSSSFPARSAPAWRDRNVSAVLRVCALARRMGKRRFELPPARRLVFLNVLVTVQTEMFDWVWTETRHSNATWELTPLPCEMKQTVTFLNSAVVPLQLEHSHFTKTFIILGSVSEFGWQIMLPPSV